MELSEEKIWLYGLFVSCPQGTPLASCPLEKYRILSYYDRLSALKELTTAETKEIIDHHNRCLLRRV